jgi:hypothetical protein
MDVGLRHHPPHLLLVVVEVVQHVHEETNELVSVESAPLSLVGVQQDRRAQLAHYSPSECLVIDQQIIEQANSVEGGLRGECLHDAELNQVQDVEIEHRVEE